MLFKFARISGFEKNNCLCLLQGVVHKPAYPPVDCYY